MPKKPKLPPSDNGFMPYYLDRFESRFKIPINLLESKVKKRKISFIIRFCKRYLKDTDINTSRLSYKKLTKSAFSSFKTTKFIFSLVIYQIVSLKDCYSFHVGVDDEYKDYYLKIPPTIKKHSHICELNELKKATKSPERELADRAWQYFNKKGYKTPVPLLIEFGEHYDSFSSKYHTIYAVTSKLLLDSPEFASLIDIAEHEIERATGGHFLLFKDPLFPKTFLAIYLCLRNFKTINRKVLKRVFASQMKPWKTRISPIDEFYSRVYFDFMEEAETYQIARRCRGCNKIFDYKYNKLHCSDKCGRVARNIRDYLKHAKLRRKRSKLRMRYARKNSGYTDQRTLL